MNHRPSWHRTESYFTINRSQHSRAAGETPPNRGTTAIYSHSEVDLLFPKSQLQDSELLLRWHAEQGSASSGTHHRLVRSCSSSSPAKVHSLRTGNCSTSGPAPCYFPRTSQTYSLPYLQALNHIDKFCTAAKALTAHL